MPDEILRMEGITKVYGNGFIANKNVTLVLHRGEILALCGENGAGKTTLMKILFGMEKCQRGRIEIQGKEANIQSPLDAIALGVGMVHQHFMQVPSATIAKTEGIAITGGLIVAQLLAGAIAGMGGAIDIMGVYDRYFWDVTPGVGSDGLLIAVLARKSPALVPIAAFLLAYMRTGAAILNYSTDIPLEMVQVMQGIIILMIGAEKFLGPIKSRLIYRLAEKKERERVAQRTRLF